MWRAANAIDRKTTDPREQDNCRPRPPSGNTTSTEVLRTAATTSVGWMPVPIRLPENTAGTKINNACPSHSPPARAHRPARAARSAALPTSRLQNGPDTDSHMRTPEVCPAVVKNQASGSNHDRMPPWHDRQRPQAALLGYDVTSVFRVAPGSSRCPQVTRLGGAEGRAMAGWEPLANQGGHGEGEEWCHGAP